MEGRKKTPYSIHKRPTKKKKKFIYYAKFRDPDTEEYRTAVSTGCSNRDDAIRWCEKKLAEGLLFQSGQTFSSYLETFWEDTGEYAWNKKRSGRPLSIAYLEANRGAVKNYVLPYLRKIKKERIPLSKVSRALIEAVLRHLDETTDLSAARINSIRKAITVPLSQAYELGMIPRNPARNALVFKENALRRKVLSLGEARKFFALEWTEKRHKVIIRLAASTGLRMGECRGLLRGDLRRETYTDPVSDNEERVYY